MPVQLGQKGSVRSGTPTTQHEAAISRWLNDNPPVNPNPDRCGYCHEPVGEIGQDTVPFLLGGGGYVWLHHQCWPGWTAARRQEAIDALGLGETRVQGAAP